MNPANLLIGFLRGTKTKICRNQRALNLKDRRIGAPSNVPVSRILFLYVRCCQAPRGPQPLKQTPFNCGRSPRSPANMQGQTNAHWFAACGLVPPATLQQVSLEMDGVYTQADYQICWGYERMRNIQATA
ncbi:hypothetical protein SCLCIDRAFT_285201 [Scleroderma citrinum Foug A]|uniref:Uncharacterized protein n=1 Tax=Scleroderma citrinum Foug A TaxID=1036808 RepID=A0A0C2Z1M0_9AGAM|nr:hypothetical protein SCLCIDRAFT_285201 [Scleroderma citrinum Foug A]